MYQKHNRFYADWTNRKGSGGAKLSSQRTRQRRTSWSKRRSHAQKADEGKACHLRSLGDPRHVESEPSLSVAHAPRMRGTCAIAACAGIGIEEMRRHHVITAFQSFNGYAVSTRYQRTQALGQLLHLLTDEDDAPKLWKYVPKVQLALPRNVTVTSKEKEAVLAISSPYMRCWILLCSDLAMRSGTAAQIRPSQYDAERREVTFTTKYGEKLTLPVTDELKQLFEAAIALDKGDTPFVSALHPNGTIGVLMLRQRFQMLCKDAKVSKRICP